MEKQELQNRKTEIENELHLLNMADRLTQKELEEKRNLQNELFNLYEKLNKLEPKKEDEWSFCGTWANYEVKRFQLENPTGYRYEKDTCGTRVYQKIA